MLVEVYGYEVRENFVEVLRLLEQPSSSIRIKIGRPDITSSIFSISGDKEVCVFLSPISGVQWISPYIFHFIVRSQSMSIVLLVLQAKNS